MLWMEMKSKAERRRLDARRLDTDPKVDSPNDPAQVGQGQKLDDIPLFCTREEISQCMHTSA